MTAKGATGSRLLAHLLRGLLLALFVLTNLAHASPAGRSGHGHAAAAATHHHHEHDDSAVAGDEAGGDVHAHAHPPADRIPAMAIANRIASTTTPCAAVEAIALRWPMAIPLKPPCGTGTLAIARR